MSFIAKTTSKVCAKNIKLKLEDKLEFDDYTNCLSDFGLVQ